MDGYLLIPNVFTEQELERGCCIQGDQVDYPRQKEFIDQILLPRLKHAGMEDPTYVKFRLSNNNNSTDASTFHGDIYNHTSSEIMPIYTALVYFDEAQIQVIPGSHRFHNPGWSISSYQKRKTLTIHRGDLLVFHANLHHRGVKFDRTGDRRLLQVFEIFPDRPTYEAFAPMLMVVKTSNHSLVKHFINPVMYECSKYPALIDFLTFIHYLLMYNNLHYKMSMMDLAPWDKKDKYVTYEPSRCAHMDETHYEDLNINIQCDHSIQTSETSNFYLYAYVLYWIVSGILLYLLYRWLRPKQKRISRKRLYKYKMDRD